MVCNFANQDDSRCGTLCRFAARQTLMATKEAKRVVRVYNRVARALIEFETLWQQAWLQSIEVARAGLQATLIVAHPDTGFAPMSKGRVAAASVLLLLNHFASV